MAEPQIPHVVIIGGGFSGTALAIHLARQASAPLRVTVIEPRAQLAQGVAYSTTEPAHRINVPAVRMQLSGDAARLAAILPPGLPKPRSMARRSYGMCAIAPWRWWTAW